jgi:hypothetical protein
VLGLELKPVLTVVGPAPGALHVFTGRDARRRADDGHQLTLAADLDSQHAEAALWAVKGDALDRALQMFGCGGFRM